MGLRQMEESELKFEFHNVAHVLVLKLNGALTRAHSKVGQEIIEQVKTHEFKNLVIDLKAVHAIDNSSYRFLVQLQHYVKKDLEGVVKIASLSAHYKDQLCADGIVKNEDLFSDLKAAIVSFTKG